MDPHHVDRRPPPDPGPPRKPLSRESIVTAALGVLDRSGLDALNMRGVAQELGTGPASLYAHVSGKDELLDLVLERVLGEIALPSPGGDWRRGLRDLAFEIRRTLLAHADVARVALSGAPAGPNGLAIGETILGTLRAAGFPAHTCTWVVDRLCLYVTADVVASTLHLDDADKPEDSIPESEAGERFAFGLDLLLTGLATRLAHPPAEGDGPRSIGGL